MPQIDAGLVPRRCATCHQPAAAGQCADTSLPGRLADVLDDDVGAAAVGASPQLLGEIAGMVVERLFGAELTRLLQFRR